MTKKNIINLQFIFRFLCTGDADVCMYKLVLFQVQGSEDMLTDFGALWLSFRLAPGFPEEVLDLTGQIAVPAPSCTHKQR